MQVLCLNLAALCIALLYYFWRDQIVAAVHRQKLLRDRVAFMLWCAANQTT